MLHSHQAIYFLQINLKVHEKSLLSNNYNNEVHKCHSLSQLPLMKTFEKAPTYILPNWLAYKDSSQKKKCRKWQTMKWNGFADVTKLILGDGYTANKKYALILCLLYR